MRTENGIDSSILVKPPAIVVWFVICILSVLFDKTVLGFFAGFVFILSLSSYLWARASLKNVDFDLTVDSAGVFPGQIFTVTRTLGNHKALPMLWAEIRETCELSDCAAPRADVIVGKEVLQDPDKGPEMVYQRLYSLSLVKWHRTISFRDEWEAKRRGILEIGASLLRSGDGFGLSAEGKKYGFSAPGRIVIYPQLSRTSVAEILIDMWDTRSETDGFLKDRTIIKSVRDYLPGDAARDVNMRMLARGQGLMTSVFETVAPDTVLFVLDAGSFHESASEVFERALSTTASLIEGLTQRGIQVALMTPASKWFGETCTRPSSLERDRFGMFELLAAASQNDAAFTPDICLLDHEPGRIYIVCADWSRLTVPAACLPFPEHKILCLTADEGGGGAVAFRSRNLFDFERAV